MPEHVEQFCIADALRVVDNLYCLGMAGAAARDLLVGRVLLVAAGVGLAGMAGRAEPQAAAQAAPPAVAAPADFTLGIGDQLTVNVWRDPDASAAVIVRPDGRISLPLIGELQVLGMTPAALLLILAKLRKSNAKKSA